MNFGKEAVSTTCTHCNNAITTRVEQESTSSTHLAAVLLCICCCPLVCCPYLMDCFKASNHYCPQCNVILGTYRE